jgi:hypothetical protein
MKSGNLNFLELSGPLQACNGTALPLPFLKFQVFWDSTNGDAKIVIDKYSVELSCHFIGASEVN